MTDVSPFPKFDTPPVIETILGVHFRPLVKLTSAHQGLLWGRCFRERFPKVEERPPVEEVREVFGKESRASRTIRWQVSDRPSSPRLWMASPDDEHIVQVQRDAILANWLRKETPGGYRFFQQRREAFAEDLRRLDSFVQENGLGEVVPTSCEVTYINHLKCTDPAELATVLAKTFPFWKNETTDGWLPALDEFNLHVGYPMPDQRGRLHLIVVPVVRHSDNCYLLRAELTARGEPVKQEIPAALDWIDLGHEWVVRGFASLTSSEMQKTWGRTQ